MSDAERLKKYLLFELYNVAEHVTRCTEDARAAAKRDDFDEVAAALRAAEQSARLVDMHFSDALKAAESARGAR